MLLLSKLAGIAEVRIVRNGRQACDITAASRPIPLQQASDSNGMNQYQMWQARAYSHSDGSIFSCSRRNARASSIVERA